jgi:hypothetical protein
VRPPVVVLTAVVAMTGTACSGFSKGSATTLRSACPRVAELDRTARAVGRADVADPGRFEQTLDTATKHYASTARKLRAAVPTRLQRNVDRLEAAVDQYRFADAATARHTLDDYVARRCGTSSVSG